MLRIYTLGNNGFASQAVLRLLDAPSHVRQVRALICAPSKAAARRMVSRFGFANVPAVLVTQAMGNDVDALKAAGLFDEPAFLALSLLHVGKVVRVDDPPEVIGTIRYTGGMRMEFVPGGES